MQEMFSNGEPEYLVFESVSSSSVTLVGGMSTSIMLLGTGHVSPNSRTRGEVTNKGTRKNSNV